MKSMTIEGIVVKLTEDKIVVMTEDGSFKNVSLTSYQGQIPLIGETIVHTEKKKSKYSYKPYLSIASLFILAFAAYLFFPLGGKNVPAYMVAIDINPSIELTIDKELNVIDKEGLNQEGIELLEEIAIDRPLSVVVESIIDLSTEKGFIPISQDVFIAASVISVSDQSEEEIVEELVANALDNKNTFNYAVSIEAKEIYEEAREINLSVNHYKQAKVLQEKGIIEQPSDIRGKRISELKKMENTKNEIPNQQQDKPDEKGNSADQKERPVNNNNSQEQRNKQVPAAPSSNQKDIKVNINSENNNNNSNQSNQKNNVQEKPSLRNSNSNINSNSNSNGNPADNKQKENGASQDRGNKSGNIQGSSQQNDNSNKESSGKSQGQNNRP